MYTYIHRASATRPGPHSRTMARPSSAMGRMMGFGLLCHCMIISMTVCYNIYIYIYVYTHILTIISMIITIKLLTCILVIVVMMMIVV